MRTLRVITRRSDLALKQAMMPIIPLLGEGSRGAFGKLPINYEIIPTDTIGDLGKFKDHASVTSEIGKTASEKAAWFLDIDIAIGVGSGDIGIHSGKDVPPEIHPQTKLYPILGRDDARDAFISLAGGKFRDLPSGAVIGTNSKRRRAQLSLLRPDLKFVDYGGNVTKRVSFATMNERKVDGIVVAAAGLERLGDIVPAEVLKHRELIEFQDMMPCVNQAIIVAQCREDDIELCEMIEQRLVWPSTKFVWQAERSALETLNVGCKHPLAIHATQDRGVVTLAAKAFSEDGRLVQYSNSSPEGDAKELGIEAGRKLQEEITTQNIW